MPVLIATPFATNGTKNDIPETTGAQPQNATMDEGFPAITQQPISTGGIPPERADFNGILYALSDNISHINKGLAYSFDTAFATKIGGYPLHAELVIADGTRVVSTIANNMNNPDVDMTGWVKVNSASQVVDESGKSQQQWNNGVESIADLLSIPNPKNGNRQYVKSYYAGLNKGGGTFIYDATKSNINDSGVVINGWVRQNVDYLNFSMFGVDSNDAARDINKLYLVANALNLPVINNDGVYVLKGSQNITIKTNSDLTGTVFKFDSSYTGRVVLRNSDTTIYDDTSQLIADLSTSSAVLKSGEVLFDALSSIEDSYLVIETKQPFYNYRGNIYNRKHFTSILRRGFTSKPLKYDLKLSDITGIRVYPFVSKKTLKGLTLDFSELNSSVDTYKEVFGLNGCVNFDVECTIKNGGVKPSTYISAYVYNSFNCTLELSADSNIKNETSSYSYTILIDNSHEIKLHRCKAFGDGWGAQSGSSIGDLLISDSDICLVDAHQLMYGDVTVRDTIFYGLGLGYNTIGDTYVNNCKLILNDRKPTDSFFKSRYDVGGWCDGNIYIDGLTIYGKATSQVLSLLGNNADTYLLPAGSPIQYRFFKDISIKNVSDKSGRLNALFNNLAIRNKSKIFDSLTIENITDVGDDFTLNIQNGCYLPNQEPVNISLSNVKASSLRCTTLDPSAGGTFRNDSKVRLSLINLFYTKDRGVRLDIDSPVELVSVGGTYARYRYHGAADATNFANSSVTFVSPTFKSNSLDDSTVVNLNEADYLKIGSVVKFVAPTFEYSVEKRYTWNKLFATTLIEPTFDSNPYITVTSTATSSFSYDVPKSNKLLKFMIKTGASVGFYDVWVGENQSFTSGGLTIAVSDSTDVIKKTVTFNHSTSNEIKYIRLMG